MQKRRVTILAGPIAAGKTSLAALFDTRKVRVISFDDHAHVFHPDTGYNNTATNVDDTIERLIKTINASHQAHEIVIDGWFSFYSQWWKSHAIMPLTLKVFADQLGEGFELQPCIVSRSKDEILKCIANDEHKFKYQDYDKVIDEKYKVMTDSIVEWQGENGTN